jgi:hypothetical protein
VLPVVEDWRKVGLEEALVAVARMVRLGEDKWAGHFGCMAVVVVAAVG